MTPVGHSLTGIVIGIFSIPKICSDRIRIVYLIFFIILANIPDLPIQGWAHDNYRISHSIFVNMGFIAVITIVLWLWGNIRTKIGGWEVVIGGILAWLSHFLLDLFYNRARGIMIFWPFSEARLNLPIPWFSILGRSSPLISMHSLKILLIELASYFPFILVAVWFRCYKKGKGEE